MFFSISNLSIQNFLGVRHQLTQILPTTLTSTVLKLIGVPMDLPHQIPPPALVPAPQPTAARPL